MNTELTEFSKEEQLQILLLPLQYLHKKPSMLLYSRDKPDENGKGDFHTAAVFLLHGLTPHQDYEQDFDALEKPHWITPIRTLTDLKYTLGVSSVPNVGNAQGQYNEILHQHFNISRFELQHLIQQGYQRNPFFNFYRSQRNRSLSLENKIAADLAKELVAQIQHSEIWKATEIPPMPTDENLQEKFTQAILPHLRPHLITPLLREIQKKPNTETFEFDISPSPSTKSKFLIWTEIQINSNYTNPNTLKKEHSQKRTLSKKNSLKKEFSQKRIL